MHTYIQPVQLWTGKQLTSILLRLHSSSSSPASSSSSSSSSSLVNLETPARNFTSSYLSSSSPHLPPMCPRDGYVVIRNSEVRFAFFFLCACSFFSSVVLFSSSSFSLSRFSSFCFLLPLFSPDLSALVCCFHGQVFHVVMCSMPISLPLCLRFAHWTSFFLSLLVLFLFVFLCLPHLLLPYLYYGYVIY